MKLARQLARRCDGLGADPADLESDATMALLDAARYFVDQYGNARTFRSWATLCIMRRLRKSVAHAPYVHVAMPRHMRDSVEQCRFAVDRLAARGIHRPNARQIAGEALLNVETVEIVMEIPKVFVLQSAVEWAENRSTARGPDEPELVPAFGPQPGWSPDRACEEVCRHPVPKDSTLCCMQCHESGMDHMPALKKDKFTDPKPEAKRVAAPRPTVESRQHETRAQRRQRLFPPQHPGSA